MSDVSNIVTSNTLMIVVFNMSFSTAIITALLLSGGINYLTFVEPYISIATTLIRTAMLL